MERCLTREDSKPSVPRSLIRICVGHRNRLAVSQSSSARTLPKALALVARVLRRLNEPMRRTEVDDVALEGPEPRLVLSSPGPS